MREDLIDQMYLQEKYYWWHRAKRRLVLLLINQYKASSKIKILDVGCGTGLLLEELTPYGNVWGVDTSNKALTWCKKRGLKNVRKGSLGKSLPFKDESLNFVLLLDVLEHVENDYEAIKEVKRITKKNSYIIITVPAYQFLFSSWDRILGHKRRYTAGSLKKMLTKESFVPIQVSYFHSFLLPVALVFRPVKRLLKLDTNSDFIEMPKFLHNFFLLLSSFELKILNYLPIPFGLSIVGVFKKNE